MNKVYIISGPIGVGKTTTSKALAQMIGGSALIEGDIFLHALEGRDELTWEQKLEMSWEKIISQTKVSLSKGLNVVVDFVVRR